MAILFGRVDKSEWEHTGLFANIVPVYMRNLESGEPDCALLTAYRNGYLIL